MREERGIFDGINGMDGMNRIGEAATELRRQWRSQIEFGNEGNVFS